MPAAQITQSLTALIHGPSKVGKSMLGVSLPKPLCLLDVEFGAQHLPIRGIPWNPFNPPPKVDGTWDTAVVSVGDWDTATKTLEKLRTTPHPFKGLTLDSLGALQRRKIDAIAGVEGVEIQQWGMVFREVTNFLEQMRDLTRHPRFPIEAVCVVSPTRKNPDTGIWGPMVSGQLKDISPYIFDLTGYLYTKKVPDKASGKQVEAWFLQTRRSADVEAGQRVQGKLPEVLRLPSIYGTRTEVITKNNTFQQMLAAVYKDTNQDIAPPAVSDAPPPLAPPPGSPETNKQGAPQ